SQALRKTPPRRVRSTQANRRSRSWAGADLDEIDDEHQRFVRTDRPLPARAVTERRRDDELAAASLFHAGYALLPPRDDVCEREAGRAAVIPRRVELFVVRPRDAHVLDRQRRICAR